MSVHAVELVGRERELEVLRAAAAGAREAARVVLVVGEAGVGKTRLAHELRAGLGPEWLQPASHGVDLAGGEIPWGGVTELVRHLVRELGAPEVRRILGPEAAALAAVVPGLAPATGPLDRAAATGAVLTLLDAVGRPVCWLLDDAQWIDATTIDAVRYLARAATSPLLLLLTVRTSAEHRSDLPSSLADLGRAGEVVTLAPLGRTDVRRQVGLLDGTLAPEAVDRICEASDGLPFFVEALVAGGGVPDGTLQSVLRSTLGALSPAAGRLLGAAAVGDGLLLPTYLRRVVDRDDFDRALDEVRAAGVLVTDADAGTLRFRHALLREEVDSRLLVDERRDLHAAWAAALEVAVTESPFETALVVERGRHLWALRGPDALSAVRAAAEAADHLQDDHARRLWWARVLHLLPERHDARDLVVARLFSAQRAVGWLEEVLEVVDLELEGETDWLRVLWLRFHEWNARRALQLEFGAVVVPIEEAEATVERLDALPRDFRATTVRVALADELMGHRPDLAARLLSAALAAPTEDDDPLTLAEGWSLLSWLDAARGDTPEAVRTMQRGIDALGGWPEAVRDLRCFLGLRLMDAGEVEAARRAMEENLVMLRDGELHPIRWTQMQMLLAMVHVVRGAWPSAEQRLATAAEGAFGGDIESWWHHLSAMLAARKGDVDDARRHLSEIPVPPEGTPRGSRWSFEAILRAVAGEGIAVAEDDVPGAHAAYREHLAATGPGDPVDDLLSARILLLRIVPRSEADADARAVAAEAAAAADEWESVPNPWIAVMCAELRAHVRRLDDADDAVSWAAVTDRWETLLAPWEVAWTRLFEAECAARDGDASRAREVLGLARQGAADLGAAPLVRRIDRTARRIGVPLGATRRSSDGTLTSREREVLALVAEGRTNPQIAEELVMSPKTVSVHVSHLIAKLGVANRTEAASYALREGLLDHD